MATSDTANKQDTSKKFTVPSTKSVGITVLVIAGALVVFMAGVGVERHSEPQRGGLPVFGVAQDNVKMRGRPGHEYGFDSIRPDNQNRLSGVVTAVDGDSFTLAGNGTTNSVKTNSDTKYTGADKVEVNDSVRVTGTIADGTFTATTVLISTN